MRRVFLRNSDRGENWGTAAALRNLRIMRGYFAVTTPILALGLTLARNGGVAVCASMATRRGTASGAVPQFSNTQPAVRLY
jgi:hypothetical protein